MNPMDWQETVLPEDLHEIEQMLRAAPPPAPPALFERITASREIAVVVERMLLTDDPFAKRSQRYRTLISVAASALLMVGAFGVWRYVDSRTPTRTNVSKTPSVAARNQVARLPNVSAVPEASFDEFARLLQPWPTSGRPPRTLPDERLRAPGAVLEPGARDRIKPFVAVYRRMIVDSRERLLSDSELEISLGRVRNEDQGLARWVLSTHPLSRNQRPLAHTDSIILDDLTLQLRQRRVHGDSINRYQRFTPSEALGTDTLAEYFFNERVMGVGTRFEPVSGPLYWYKPLNPRHTLVVSEAHLALVLRTYPLWVGWKMTVGALSSTQNRFSGSTKINLLNLRVAALDSLTVRQERVPSYRVEIDYGARPDIWWINAENGQLMRSERSSSAGKEITRLVSQR